MRFAAASGSMMPCERTDGFTADILLASCTTFVPPSLLSLSLSLTTCGISSVVFSIDRSASSSHHHSCCCCCCFSAHCPIPRSSNLQNTKLPDSSSHPAASTPLVPPKQNPPILHHIELSPRHQKLPTTLLPSITQRRQQEQDLLTSDTQTVREQSLKSMTTNKQDRKNKKIKKIRRGYNSEKTGDHQDLSKIPSSHLPTSSKHHPFEENAKLEETHNLKNSKEKTKTSSAAGAAEITTHFSLATDYHSCNNNNNQKIPRKSPLKRAD